MLQEAADKTTGARIGQVSYTRPRSYIDPAPQNDRRQLSPGTPNRTLPRQMDTPASALRSLDAPGSQRLDPNYVPPDTPRSRRELGTTRLQPHITRIQSKLQVLPEAPEDDY